MSDHATTSGEISAVKKLVQAAALAALLVPLGSVASEAGPITCGFGGVEGDPCGAYNPIGSGFAGRTYFFGDYTFELDFDTVNGPFLVTINDVSTTQAAVASRLADNFPGYLCVPIGDGLSECIEFEVDAPDPGESTWEGSYNMFISWFANTDPTYPNEPGDRIRIVHNLGSTETTNFETDITTPGTYFAAPPSDSDPGLGGRDDNFQSFLVVQAPLDQLPAPIPEPTSIVLLGTGAGAALYRKLRGQKNQRGN